MHFQPTTRTEWNTNRIFSTDLAQGNNLSAIQLQELVYSTQSGLKQLPTKFFNCIKLLLTNFQNSFIVQSAANLQANEVMINDPTITSNTSLHYLVKC